MQKTNYYYEVVLKSPLFKSLTYRSFEPLSLGQKVQVSMGKKKLSAVIFKEDPQAHKYKNLKTILKVEKDFPPLSEPRLKWLEWLSGYYYYPMGLIADLSFPPLSFKEKKLQKSENLEFLDAKNKIPIKLNEEQKQCVKSILKDLKFKTHLLHGVTGSGKTEVYKTITEEILKQNKQVLILLPEIFLTPQIVERFSEKFPNQVAVLHSQITPRQKTEVWEQLLTHKKKILIGTRSALFCPLPNLGMIVIDEEHDGSFKQEEKFRYHARDSAIVLAKKLDIPIVLGSATPSLSSWYQAEKGVYQIHRLSERAFKQSLPLISIVDLRKNTKKEERPFWFSEELFLKMQKTLDRKKQVALFLNRRGVANSLMCMQCGHTVICPNCDISLTLHKGYHLLCHYCAYMERKPERCPSCKEDRWFEKGLGTEGVEQVMRILFPEVKIIRADRDAIDSRKEMENFMRIVEKQEAQIIIGTQMLSKGLDFPSIQLVGLLLADMGFHFPDFRATERTVQILLQMAGRAGRKEGGEVILQTFNPEHLSLGFMKDHNYAAFSKEELKIRKKLFYPPFSRLCLLEIDSLKEKEGEQFAVQLAHVAKSKKPKEGMVILGPSPAPIFKIKNRYRFQILIKSLNHKILQNFLDDFLKSFKEKSFVRVKLDRDPNSMI